MPSGFVNSSGVDLDDLFAFYNSGTKGAATGYVTGGADLVDRYQPGNAGISTGYVSNGTDLGNRFAAKTAGGVTSSPTSVYRTGLRGNTLSQLLTLSGGSGSYTLTWDSGGANINVTGTGNTRTVSSSTTAGALDIIRSGNLRVADSANASLFVVVPVYFEHAGSG